MQLKKLSKRIIELGPIETWNRIVYQFKKKAFALRWKKKALAKSYKKQSFSSLKLNDFTGEIIRNYEFQNHLPIECVDQKIVIRQADQFCHNTFDLLGSGVKTFEKIPWKYDFKHCLPQVFPDLFYQELHASSLSSLGYNCYAPDIKVPWELSRFQHLFYLGRAYEITGNRIYVQTFVDHAADWIDQNPFLVGVNWACPMEVAIRAINWIFAFHFFKNEPTIPADFWQNFIGSLYEHAYYLKHNWETSYRPNNHYIADLVGYFYLCNFFEAIPLCKKAKKFAYKKILKQFDHQIHPDGTSYEGSTAYHKLNTELFWLFSLACQATKIKLPTSFDKKLATMFAFIEHCSITKQELVQIGDNDSGKIVTGIQFGTAQAKEIRHYSNFGITIIKHDRWHITFRHPTYQTHQPTGHFHRDELSITIAYKNIPILVDSGSYLYTANATWRNLMRSHHVHNTFYPETYEEVDTSIDLFQLPKQLQSDTAQITEDNNTISIQNHFKNQKRKLTFDKNNNNLVIEDFLRNDTGHLWVWILMFHPSIAIIQKTKHCWQICHNKKKLLTLESNLFFSSTDGFYSPHYGVVQSTKKLVGSKSFSHKDKTIVMIEMSPAKKL